MSDDERVKLVSFTGSTQVSQEKISMNLFFISNNQYSLRLVLKLASQFKNDSVWIKTYELPVIQI